MHAVKAVAWDSTRYALQSVPYPLKTQLSYPYLIPRGLDLVGLLCKFKDVFGGGSFVKHSIICLIHHCPRGRFSLVIGVVRAAVQVVVGGRRHRHCKNKQWSRKLAT